MNRLEEIVTDCKALDTYAVLALPDQWLMSQDLRNALSAEGFFVALIQAKIATKQELLTALFQSCHFPEWFGFNWDALADSLRDFHWQPAAGYVLIFEQPLALEGRDQEIFLDILEQSQLDWAKSAKLPFKALMPEAIDPTTASTWKQPPHRLAQIDQIIAQCSTPEASAIVAVEPEWLDSLPLERAFQWRNYVVAHVMYESAIDSDEKLFIALFKACHFPWLFGFNWASLEQYLTDFHWRPASGYILILHQPLLLSQESQARFIEIAARAKTFWANQNLAFGVLMSPR